MPTALRFLAVLAALASPLQAAGPIDAALELYRKRDYPAAREALEKIVAVEPGNAAAHYYLGMTVSRRADEKALAEAVRHLERASALEPSNSTYLADYGGLSLLLAEKNRSLATANRGRDALEKALKMNPDNLDAREGLYRFYTEAPWPLGNRTKARAHLAEIARRDPARAESLGKSAKP